jgi:hypothetical protein
LIVGHDDTPLSAEEEACSPAYRSPQENGNSNAVAASPWVPRVFVWSLAPPYSDRMSDEQIQFRFTIASLFRATLYAAAAVFMFTMPIGDHLLPGRVIAAFCFGGAAIGTLFEQGGYGAVGGYMVFLIGATLG